MKLKLVAFLLGMHFTSYSHALGLGELSVLSSLDQPLHATVELLGAPPAMEASCLSLRGSDNGLPVPAHAEFRIERKGDNALLHITTPRAINDPIAQFVLTSDCEGRLQREYVLLLDPPTHGEPARLAESQPAESYAGTRMPSNPVSGSLSAATSHAALPPADAKPRASRTPVRHTARPKSGMPTATPAANKPPVATRAPLPIKLDRAASPQARVTTATPRLVISGKRDVSQSGNLPAGSEKGSALSEQSTRSSSLTTTELSDENTALNHRLAHLESQIAALQKRNAELEAQRALPSIATATVQPAAPQASPWPLYMIGVGLFTLSGVLLAGLRRRRELASGNDRESFGWVQPLGSGSTMAPVETRSSARRPGDTPQPRSWKNAVEDQDFPGVPLDSLARGTEVKEDILNQAEVYVAHGYPNLAISLLQEHLHDVPDGSPVPWMLLLDLLLREGDEEGYVKASAQCRRHFNVNFSVHPVSQEQEGSQRGLEAYPHILDMLSQAWSTPEREKVFKDLIYDQRDGVRMGFEPEAYRDILLLRSIAQEKTLQAAV